MFVLAKMPLGCCAHPWQDSSLRLAALRDQFIGKIRVNGAAGNMWAKGVCWGVGTFLSYTVAVEKLILAVNHDIMHLHG